MQTHKLTQADVDLAIANGEVNKPIRVIIPPSHLTAVEMFVSTIFPPGVEDVVPSNYREFVIDTRRELIEMLKIGLSNDDRSKNLERSCIISEPYLKKVTQLIPNYMDLCTKTDFVIKGQDIIAHNCETSEKYAGKYIRLCAQCQKKGIWQRCTGCKKVHYCSKTCQAAAWNDHKGECTSHWKL